MALDFAAKHGLDIVTLVLPLVVGPFLCPYLPGSIHFSLAPIFDNPELYEDISNFYTVHVDDAVNAHIFVFEHPNAPGRYICSSIQITTQVLIQFLSHRYHEFQIPAFFKQGKENENYKITELSSMKLLKLGWVLKKLMFDGAIQCCKDKGLLLLSQPK